MQASFIKLTTHQICDYELVTLDYKSHWILSALLKGFILPSRILLRFLIFCFDIFNPSSFCINLGLLLTLLQLLEPITPKMLEQTTRGNLRAALDPNNPSVSKQTMLDWLRINHPMTVISKKANKAKVARIVQEKQPQSKSDVLSNSFVYFFRLNLLVFHIKSIINSSLMFILNVCSTVFRTPGSGIPDVPSPNINAYPTLEHLRVSSPKTSFTVQASEHTQNPLACRDEKNCDSQERRPESSHLVKRSASEESDTSYPHKRLGCGEWYFVLSICVAIDMQF